MTGCDDKKLRIFDADTLQVLHEYEHGDRVKCAAFSHDGKRILTGCDDKKLRVFDADTLQVLQEHACKYVPEMVHFRQFIHVLGYLWSESGHFSKFRIPKEIEKLAVYFTFQT